MNLVTGLAQVIRFPETFLGYSLRELNLNSLPKAPMQTQESTATAPAKQSALPQQFDYLDLKAQFSTIRDEVMAAITRVMESQHFILGSEVTKFEDEVAHLLGARHAISCASGSDALVLAMM